MLLAWVCTREYVCCGHACAWTYVSAFGVYMYTQHAMYMYMHMYMCMYMYMYKHMLCCVHVSVGAFTCACARQYARGMHVCSVVDASTCVSAFWSTGARVRCVHGRAREHVRTCVLCTRVH